jgi:CO/xanthine dehydrogenase Mo-binding subunit
MAVSFAEIATRAALVAGGPILGEDALVYDGDPFDPKRTVMQGFPFGRIGTLVFGAQAIETEVDTVTDQVRATGVWAAHDVGRAINPRAVRGQIEGGVVQGQGYALTERLGGTPADAQRSPRWPTTRFPAHSTCRTGSRRS